MHLCAVLILILFGNLVLSTDNEKARIIPWTKIGVIVSLMFLHILDTSDLNIFSPLSYLLSSLNQQSDIPLLSMPRFVVTNLHD